MSQDQYKSQTATIGREIDAGLQAYMRGVFNTMSLGLGLTGLVAFAVAGIEPVAQLLFSNYIVMLIVAFAPLFYLLTVFRGSNIMRLSLAQLRTRFYMFSGLMGLSFAGIFMMFSGESIARAFFVTAGAFAATSLYGYVTKRDLTGMGSFLFMGLIGIVIASVVNFFFMSAMVHFVISVIGVVVFTGLTAFEVQRLKETYRVGAAHEEANGKMALMGALNLYLYFINLFQIILHFMGGRD